MVSVRERRKHARSKPPKGSVPRHAQQRVDERVSDVMVAAQDTGPTISAVLDGGPLDGRQIDVAIVEGRPPKTIDAPVDDGSICRYCLADWTQAGPSAAYTFLYRV